MSNRLATPEWRPLDGFRSLRDLGRQALTGLLARVDAVVDEAMDCFGDEGDD